MAAQAESANPHGRDGSLSTFWVAGIEFGNSGLQGRDSQALGGDQVPLGSCVGISKKG